MIIIISTMSDSMHQGTMSSLIAAQVSLNGLQNRYLTAVLTSPFQGLQAASQPLQRVTGYLDLPTEVRAEIIDLVWEDTWSNFHISYSRLAPTHHWYARGYGHLRRPQPQPRANLDLFLVCHQFREDAARILYGETKFTSYNATGLVHNFLPKKIGSFNASFIRSLLLGVPEVLKVDPAENMPYFVNVFCNQLYSLNKLEFTTRFDYPANLDHKPKDRCILSVCERKTCHSSYGRSRHREASPAQKGDVASRVWHY